MRDLILVFAVVGILVGVGCGTARAADPVSPTSPRSDLAQYRAQSPNYSLEYLGENTPPTSDVAGEDQVQFEESQQQQTPPATELPATNPPSMWIVAGILALVIGFISYLALK